MGKEELHEIFDELARPLIKFINDNYNSHTSIIITPDSAEIVIVEMAFYTEEYIRD